MKKLPRYNYQDAVDFIRANDNYREVCKAGKATVADALNLTMARTKLVRR